MCNSTKTYGLIGKKLSHSFSADFFNRKFKREKIEAEYLNFELPTIKAIEMIFVEYPNLRGLNVTIPYKEAVVPYLDELSPAAEEAGAVNTIQFKGHKRIGHNTDVIGFEASLKPLLKPYHQKALVLGTGGAAKAVVYVLRKLGIAYQLVSRKAGANQITYDEVTPKTIEEYSLIINTTPLGMAPHLDAAPELPYEAIGPRHLLYDLIYNPEATLFLQKGKAQGAPTKNGLEMLEKQALAAWGIWNE